MAFSFLVSKMVLSSELYNNLFSTASVLPKDEDFYQFQYLRSDQVMGASVPFQLRGGEELYTIEVSPC